MGLLKHQPASDIRSIGIVRIDWGSEIYKVILCLYPAMKMLLVRIALLEIWMRKGKCVISFIVYLYECSPHHWPGLNAVNLRQDQGSDNVVELARGWCILICIRMSAVKNAKDFFVFRKY